MRILDLLKAQDWQTILAEYDTPANDIPAADDPYWYTTDDNYWERGVLSIIATARRMVAGQPPLPEVDV